MNTLARVTVLGRSRSKFPAHLSPELRTTPDMVHLFSAGAEVCPQTHRLQ